jgi:CHAD domain-containing protein
MVQARSTPSMQPIAALTTQVMALDAAMLVAVANAEVGPVHKLRTSTRRVEAQMTLLEALAGGSKPLVLPNHADEMAAVKKRLRKVRRAAGAVRDLDVQCEAILLDAPAKTEVHEGTPGDSIRKEAKKLRKHLADRRDWEAETLKQLLQKQEQKLATSLHALEQTLNPANRRVVSQAVLVDRIEHWFKQATHAAVQMQPKVGESAKDALQRSVQGLSGDALHTVRKAAKLCRYMAESAPKGSPAQALAQRFEDIQEAGGIWHDWLLLQQLSARVIGKNAALTERYRRHRDAALEEYHLKLVELLPAVVA